jgi:hypothetical protein
MTKLVNQLITPHSLVIEKTALELAAVFYEAGRSSGMTSKHRNAKHFAKANVEKFIPMAVQTLMDMLGDSATPEEQKTMIYDAFLERTNDAELSMNGIPVFRNDTPFLPDKPTLYDKPTIDKAAEDTKNLQLKREGKLHG